MKLYPYLLPMSIITFQNFTVYIFCQLHDSRPIFMRVRLPAVVSFDGVEDLFLQMYDSKLKSYKDAPDPTSIQSEGVKQIDLHSTNAKLKVDMCKYIINSDHFKLLQVKHADPMQRSVRKELKIQTEIFKELWKPGDKKAWVGGSEEGYKNEYENLFRTRSISTKRDKKEEKAEGKEEEKEEKKEEENEEEKEEENEEEKEEEKKEGKKEERKDLPKKDDKGKALAEPEKEEPKVFATDKVYVFSCVVRKPDGGFQLYYVSEDYDMNTASSKGPYVHPIAGRFIFIPNEQNKLVVHAVAQESTRSLAEKRKVSIEYVYLENKLTHATVGNSEEDPVCRMNVSQRLRLCSAIFSMREFGHKYRFLNTSGSLQTDCHKRKISYRSRAVNRKVGGKTFFEEWTFVCRPHLSRSVAGILGETNEKIVPVTFHISRGYANDKVFVHRERGGRIYPEWFLYGTGVVDDVPKAEPTKKEEKKEEEKEKKEREKEEKKEEKKGEEKKGGEKKGEEKKGEEKKGEEKKGEEKKEEEKKGEEKEEKKKGEEKEPESEPQPQPEYYSDNLWSFWPPPDNQSLLDDDYPSSSSGVPHFRFY